MHNKNNKQTFEKKLEVTKYSTVLAKEKQNMWHDMYALLNLVIQWPTGSRRNPTSHPVFYILHADQNT